MFGGIQESIKELGIPHQEAMPLDFDLKKAIDLEEKMNLARVAWQKKEEAVAEQRSFLSRIFRKQHDLGNAEGEIAEVKSEYEKLKLQYDQMTDRKNEQTCDDVMEDSVENHEEEKIFEVKIGEIQKIAEEGQVIYGKYPEFTKVDNFSEEIERLEKEATLLSEQNLQIVQDKLETIKSLDALRQNFKESYIKIFESLISVKEIDAVSSMMAQHYILWHGEEKLVKIFNDLKETMTPVQMESSGLQPAQDEKFIEWAKKILDYAIVNFDKK